MNSPYDIDYSWVQVFVSGGDSRWARFTNPRETLVANSPAEAVEVLAEVERRTDNGAWAVGYVTYEAAPAFDSALSAHSPVGPTAVFGVFDEPEFLDLPSPTAFCPAPELLSQIDQSKYEANISEILDRIAAGDTYQVNYTFGLTGNLSAPPFEFFKALSRNQPSSYAAFIEMRDWAVCSASPELFFELSSGRIITKPMKGTTGLADAANMADDPKQVAENIMICDMMRNDLARIAQGDVETTNILEVAEYPTLKQMTSTVSATTSASLVEIFDALFPAASITGAPKYSTSQIINELEPFPRGVYTGAVGYVSPDSTRFNVAIRTAVVERHNGKIHYGVGSGIVADSSPGEEWQESHEKAAAARSAEIGLFETILWRKGLGLALAHKHIARLKQSCEALGHDLDSDQVENVLATATKELTSANHQKAIIKLIVNHGSITYKIRDFNAPPRSPQVDSVSVTWRDAFFANNKSTSRIEYDEARSSDADIYDTILVDDDGTVLESCIANVVIRSGQQFLTPSSQLPILNGLLRSELIASGVVAESVITISDLEAAEEIYLINSVRGWVKVNYVGHRE